MGEDAELEIFDLAGIRQICVYVNMHPVNQPEVMMPFAEDKVVQTHRITDETARQELRKLLSALAAWTRRLRAPRDAQRSAY